MNQTTKNGAVTTEVTPTDKPKLHAVENYDNLVKEAASSGLNLKAIQTARAKYVNAEKAALSSYLNFGKELKAASVWYDSEQGQTYFTSKGVKAVKTEFLMYLSGRSKAQTFKLIAAGAVPAEVVKDYTSGENVPTIEGLIEFNKLEAESNEETDGKEPKKPAERRNSLINLRYKHKNGKDFSAVRNNAGKWQTNLSIEDLSDIISALSSLRADMKKPKDETANKQGLSEENQPSKVNGSPESLAAINAANKAAAKAAALAAFEAMAEDGITLE
jgi:hypothetical protein